MKKIKSAYNEHLESLTPEEKIAFEKGYKKLVLSELKIAFMEKDTASVQTLVKEAKKTILKQQGCHASNRLYSRKHRPTS